MGSPSLWSTAIRSQPRIGAGRPRRPTGAPRFTRRFVVVVATRALEQACSIGFGNPRSARKPGRRVAGQFPLRLQRGYLLGDICWAISAGRRSLGERFSYRTRIRVSSDCSMKLSLKPWLLWFQSLTGMQVGATLLCAPLGTKAPGLRGTQGARRTARAVLCPLPCTLISACLESRFAEEPRPPRSTHPVPCHPPNEGRPCRETVRCT